jgi:glycosyltransferase involved in cell wall biosynthesis
LLFTGDNKDLRSRKIINQIESFIVRKNLTDHIKITGRLNKQDQLSLLNSSKALIQPTLFEGGPGGGSVYDAIALNKPVIISNIDVNKEIKYNKMLFFNPNNYKELNKKLHFLEKKYFKRNQNNIFKTNLKLRKKCGKFLLATFSSL